MCFAFKEGKFTLTSTKSKFPPLYLLSLKVPPVIAVAPFASQHY
jgi:hypothetical protein